MCLIGDEAYCRRTRTFWPPGFRVFKLSTSEMKRKEKIEILSEAVEAMKDAWETAGMFGIKVTPHKERQECKHLNKKNQTIQTNSGNGPIPYVMPYCEDCGMAFPTEGRFRCSMVPRFKE